MSQKPVGQLSLIDALLVQRSAGTGRLDRLSGLVKWYRFERLLAPLRDPSSVGRPAYPPLVMFKILLLQSLYGLSDAETEEAVMDRLSFRRFTGLALDEAVPDHSSICRFRNLLIERQMLDRLFAELDRQLDKAGLILRRGTMLDATVIDSVARPPRREGGSPSDPDARFTRRAGRPGSSYGYKAHVAVDQGSGLIRRCITTPANVNDTVPADQLICGDEATVLADAAYHTRAREAALKAAAIRPRLMRRPNQYHALTPRMKYYNRLISRQRAAVETTFATLKRRMGHDRIRYRGLVKAAAQMLIAAMAFNLRRWSVLATP